MIAFICLFFPAVLSLFLYEKILKKQNPMRKTIFLYIIFNMIINVACFAVKRFAFGTADTAFYIGWDVTPGTALNYLIIAIPAAVFTALICSLISKTVKIERTDK